MVAPPICLKTFLTVLVQVQIGPPRFINIRAIDSALTDARLLSSIISLIPELFPKLWVPCKKAKFPIIT